MLHENLSRKSFYSLDQYKGNEIHLEDSFCWMVLKINRHYTVVETIQCNRNKSLNSVPMI